MKYNIFIILLISSFLGSLLLKINFINRVLLLQITLESLQMNDNLAHVVLQLVANIIVHFQTAT